jgi:hypothetical protein
MGVLVAEKHLNLAEVEAVVQPALGGAAAQAVERVAVA